MYRRLIVVSAIIFTAFAAFSILGFHSISLHADGLKGKRIVEFSEVAEQIRIDVKRKLDKLIQTEQKRPYTDYQYFYAPEIINNGFNNDGNVILRSPLAKSMSHGMAYGHFQIEPNGKIVSPFYAEGLNEKLDSEKQLYISNLNENIANSLKNNASVTTYLNIKRKALAKKTPAKSFSRLTDRRKSRTSKGAKSLPPKKTASEVRPQLAKNSRANYNVDTFQEERNQKSQILTQSRNTVYVNKMSNSIQSTDEGIYVQADQDSLMGVEAETAAGSQPQRNDYYQQTGRQTIGQDRKIAEIARKPTPHRSRASQSPNQSSAASLTKSKKENAHKTLAAAPKIGKSLKDSKEYPRNTEALKLKSQSKRGKNDSVDKDRDAYNKPRSPAEYVHNSTSQAEYETREEKDISDSKRIVNGPTIQGGSVPTDQSGLRRKDANLSGVALAVGQKEQKLLPDYRVSPPAEQIALDSNMEISQAWNTAPMAIADNETNSQRQQVYADQSSPGYNYEQTLQEVLQDALKMPPNQQLADDMVQIRIEPFYPITVNAAVEKDSYFDSQVFLLRHVQIEDSHFLQGFRLNEKELIAEVKKSAAWLLSSGMGFELSKNESPDAAYAAVLDFEFGQIVLNLMELKPQWIADQVSQLKNWYFAIVTIVLIATLLAMLSLWRNLNAQVKLARKKDDFISAVSHELRTPLTTIRMYTEMLEKNWVKTDDKRTEYYTTMRHESERLTRLIENVLDFSRIQRGKKRYNFALGDINSCIREVVEMMTPCAAKQDFTIETDLSADIPGTSFDSDAVMQIVINLVDNALKYAANATDKTVTVRTRTEGKYVLIEVADHGPGIPHTQRKKIFDEFYRIAEESKRETTGTGLGLALVKRFADAHNGFVEAISAKPNGALLRVAIASTTT